MKEMAGRTEEELEDRERGLIEAREDGPRGSC